MSAPKVMLQKIVVFCLQCTRMAALHVMQMGSLRMPFEGDGRHGAGGDIALPLTWTSECARS